MGLTIELQTELGRMIQRVTDPTNILHKLLPSANDESSRCLRFIDWYGDTTFNELQMDEFLREWTALYSDANTDETTLLRQVESLAQICRDGHHRYLKFIGD